MKVAKPKEANRKFACADPLVKRSKDKKSDRCVNITPHGPAASSKRVLLSEVTKHATRIATRFLQKAQIIDIAVVYCGLSCALNNIIGSQQR